MPNINPSSPTFIKAEKIGYLIGRVLRYLIMGGVVVFVGGKLKPSKPTPYPGKMP